MQALAIFLPLGDGLVAGEALLLRQLARADMAVLAMIFVVDLRVRLGKRPRARREKVGMRDAGPGKQEQDSESPDGRGPSRGTIVAY